MEKILVIIGAKPISVLFTCLASGTPHPELPETFRSKAKNWRKDCLQRINA